MRIQSTRHHGSLVSSFPVLGAVTRSLSGGLNSSLMYVSVTDGVRTKIISADARRSDETLKGIHGDAHTVSDTEML